MSAASKAWVGLAAYVIVVDSALVFLEQRNSEAYFTMSTAFENALRHPVKRWPVIASWAILTVHLFDLVLPDDVRRFEPIGVFGRTLSGFGSRVAQTCNLKRGITPG